MNTKMSCKKKDLEIIFNLQWKYGPKVAERSNIVGVYDIPSTTLSWEPFKSYILKNSGTPGDDVKVSYLEDGREFPIESTLDFQTALYHFRKKAMNGEIINLRLERLSTGKKSSRFSPTCDAQTECSYDCKVDKAPEWFTSFMAEFKKEILEEVSSAITTHTAAIKSSVSHSHYPRKSKTDCAKRCRKNHHHDGNEKEVLKTMKLEKKLESKMEKLVNKSKKLKEKKMSLITKSSDSDAGHSSSKSNSEAIPNVDISTMNAAPVRSEETSIPHFMGGEVYRHCWKVINNGLVPWTEDTELHFSWGSSLLQPIQRVIPCPRLNPMEIGEIEALIHVPKICGKYQMYWHFYHKGRKFGQWLGCEIIVDKINPSEQFSTSFLRSLAARYDIPDSTPKVESEFETPYGSLADKDTVKTEKEEERKVKHHSEIWKDLSQISLEPLGKPNSFVAEIEEIMLRKSPSKIQIIENYINEVGTSAWDVHEMSHSTEMNDYEESGNLIIDEEAGGDSHSESISKIDEDASSNSTLNDMVMVNFPDEEEEEKTEGYAFVVIDGVKTPVPKKFLRPDFLETAEDAPDPKKENPPRSDEIKELEKFFGIEFVGDDFRIVKKIEADDDEGDEVYDDIPDLLPSNYNQIAVETDSNQRNEVAADASSKQSDPDQNKKEEPSRRFVFPQHGAGYEVNDEQKKGNVENEQVKSTRHFFAPRHHAGYEVIDELNFVVPSDSDVEVCNDDKLRTSFRPYRRQQMKTSPDQASSSNLYPRIDPNDALPHIPNYQQTPPELRPKSKGDTQEPLRAQSEVTQSSQAEAVATNATGPRRQTENNPSPDTASRPLEPAKIVNATPDPLAEVVSGAMNMASSALKNMVNKIIPSKNDEPGIWLNGHWVPLKENSIREKNLKVLDDMGFKNRDLNATLLARYNDDIRRVVAELVQ
ncbi:uncharacterized protein LOC123316139 [Coccinella septempunctata]|uniref:uncharacterized protein LOC123316139 n=1 Tax=Coccinella septempunctata TaxID=41139 RepID=UPI001D081BEC|nr:uncharacterized protein LOC123316139 [Coccinella septempunctata]